MSLYFLLFLFLLYIIVMWSFRLVPVSILSVYNAFVTLLLSLSLLGMCPVSFTLESFLWADLCWTLLTAVCSMPAYNIYKQIAFFVQILYVYLCFIFTGGYDHCFAVANRSVWYCRIWSHSPTCPLSWGILLLQRHWGKQLQNHTL